MSALPFDPATALGCLKCRKAPARLQRSDLATCPTTRSAPTRAQLQRWSPAPSPPVRSPRPEDRAVAKSRGAVARDATIPPAKIETAAAYACPTLAPGPTYACGRRRFSGLRNRSGRAGHPPRYGELIITRKPFQKSDYSPSMPIAYAVSPWMASSPTLSVASSMRNGVMNEITFRMMKVAMTLYTMIKAAP